MKDGAHQFNIPVHETSKHFTVGLESLMDMNAWALMHECRI